MIPARKIYLNTLLYPHKEVVFHKTGSHRSRITETNADMSRGDFSLQISFTQPPSLQPIRHCFSFEDTI